MDQSGRTISLKEPPKKIISLVPSQTEFLFELGLDQEVIAITKFCIHPLHWFRQKKRIGGTKNIDISLIHQLKPDLIIGNKEENTKEQIEELEKYYPVWISDVKTLEDAESMMLELGRMTGRLEKAEKITGRIKEAFRNISAESAKSRVNPLHSRYGSHAKSIGATQTRQFRAVYLIWREPFLTVGGDTFIHDMMKYCNLSNIFEAYVRYPEINFSQLASQTNSEERNCDLLLLSSEPFPFREIHRAELQSLLPGIKVILVNGEMFSWYGSRLLLAARYFEKLLLQIQL